MHKLVTFQTWVHRKGWWRYQQQHQDLIPVPLIDRSPCQDPFLDHLRPAATAEPVVSGLCRVWKNFLEGQVLVYLTRADVAVLRELGKSSSADRTYFAVAALRIEQVWESHAAYAAKCQARQYLTEPVMSQAPPNVLYDRRMENVVPRPACILFNAEGKRPRVGADVGEMGYRMNLNEYRRRLIKHKLRVAACRFVPLGAGAYARRLSVEGAQLLGPEDWAPYVKAHDPSFQYRIYGHDIHEDRLDELIARCFQ